MELDTIELLDVWYRRSRESQFAHYRTAKSLGIWNRVLGTTAALLAAGLGLQLVQVFDFAAFMSVRESHLQAIMGVSGLLAASITTYLTYSRMAENAERHRRTGAHFGAIRRRIEETRARTLDGDQVSEAALAEIRERLDSVAAEAPDVPPRHFRRTISALSKQGDDAPHLI